MKHKMLCGIIGFLIGSLSGVIIMCLLQINNINNDGGINNANGNEETESEKAEHEIETLLSEFKEDGR